MSTKTVQPRVMDKSLKMFQTFLRSQLTFFSALLLSSLEPLEELVLLSIKSRWPLLLNLPLVPHLHMKLILVEDSLVVFNMQIQIQPLQTASATYSPWLDQLILVYRMCWKELTSFGDVLTFNNSCFS